jgi:hypothetical protein
VTIQLPFCAFGADDAQVRHLGDDAQVTIQGRDGDDEEWVTWFSSPLGSLRNGMFVTKPSGRDFNFCRIIPEPSQS